MLIDIDTQNRCKAILQSSREVVPFSEDFSDFIRKLLPEHTPLITALNSRDNGKIIGYLTSAYHSMKWQLADAEHISGMLEADSPGQLLVEASTMRALGILQLRCLDEKQKVSALQW